MADNPIFFGRRYRLTIQPPDDAAITYETSESGGAMDIQFETTYARGQTAREGTVSILGLGTNTINKFLRLAGETRGKAMSELAWVKLEAGYYSSAGMVEVLNGFAWYASVTAPPQMWLTLKVSEYNPMGGMAIDIPSQTSPMDLQTLVETILGYFEEAEGVLFELEDKTQDQILSTEKAKQVTISGKLTLGDVIAKLNSEASDSISFILRSRGDEPDTRILEAHDKESNKSSEEDPVEVDSSSGLLAVSGINAVQGNVTTFIDGRVGDELSKLTLTSELNPQANGTYLIVRKQYKGQYMGKEWYTTYYCTERENEEAEE